MSQLSRVDFDDDLDVSFMKSKECRQLLDLSEGPKKKLPRLTHPERVTEKESNQANSEWRRLPSRKMGQDRPTVTHPAEIDNKSRKQDIFNDDVAERLLEERRKNGMPLDQALTAFEECRVDLDEMADIASRIKESGTEEQYMIARNQFKIAAAHNMLYGKIKAGERKTDNLGKRLTNAILQEKISYAKGFGSVPGCAAEHFLSAAGYGPGCSINNVYAKLQKVFGGDIRKESEQKRFMIKFIQELVKAAYSPENWSFVTVRSRDRKNELIELDTQAILEFMTATCRQNKIPLAANFTQLMMPGFVSALNNFRRKIKTTSDEQEEERTLPE